MPEESLSMSTAFDIPVDAAASREIRRRVMELAKTLPFTHGALSDIETAVGEAAVNAVRHGAVLESEHYVRVQCECQGDAFFVEITDHGHGFRPELVPIPVAEDMNLNGYGLWLMHGLMDEVEFSPAPHGGTTVRLVKRYSLAD